MISGDVSVPGAIDGDGLACVITMGRAIVMPNPNLISIRCVFDCGNVIIRTFFDALASNINISRRVQCKPIGIIVVIRGAVISSYP